MVGVEGERCRIFFVEFLVMREARVKVEEKRDRGGR